ncbi:M48 family metallopeptidase [Streptomyces atratus]|uniref:Peptidase n=1 Tax=Streptomyces atratus TaxID=1893 RepID=A0A2Z5JHV9_STRAR|nr:M48 family metallopeptidase [Streptomyces atratus]AXE79843.1 peptidase [Streptomyces atratus]
MSPTLRALRAIALFAGFYLLGILLLSVLCVLDWAAFRWTWIPVAVMVLARTSVLALPIVRGMFVPRIPKDDDVRGLHVDDTRQPRLWAMVRDLADRVGTRTPDEIVLTDQVDASAVEDTRFLGLFAGRRRLLVGLPLMAGLSEAQLRSVLAHEISHFANSDTRLTAINTRGRIQTARTITHFQEWVGKAVATERARQEKKAAKALAKGKKAKKIDPSDAGTSLRRMAALYQRYALFSRRVTLSDTRCAEFAADAAAVRIAGRDVTASALLETQVLLDMHEDYMDTYATLGVAAGMLPPPGQVLGGLRHVLAARKDELEEMRDSLPFEPSAPYTHPSVTERIARIEALPDDGRASEPVEPALGLLVDTERTLADAEEQVLTPQMLRLRRVDWPDLVHESMTTYGKWSAQKFRTAVAEVTGGDGSVTDALDALDAGAQWQIADRLPKSDEARAATGRAAREFARPKLRDGLRQLVVSEYVRQGRARWRLSWNDDDTSLELPRGHEEMLPVALDATVADVPDTKLLRELLTVPGQCA